jgi:hypothetical protein
MICVLSRINPSGEDIAYVRFDLASLSLKVFLGS